MHVLDWLLQDDAPGVQYLARLRLLGESSRSRRMVRLRRACNEYAPVAHMLERVGDALAAGNYKKYQGAYWTLLFLADLNADGRDPRARHLAKHVLGKQLENGGFSTSGTPRHEIVCLTANLLRALVHLGCGNDERVVGGYQRLARRILSHGGVPCVVLEYCLHMSCKMTLPQTLRCLAVAPKHVPCIEVNALRKLLVQQLLDVRIYRYVRPDVPEYREAVRTRRKGMKQREVRAAWLKEHRYRDEELLPKPGWLRFGFPRSYNPDLLEAMLALAELGVPHDPVMDDALDHIESKRLSDGRWRLEDSLNGKMLAQVERKGKPSKWITLRALTVLRHFGRLEL